MHFPTEDSPLFRKLFGGNGLWTFSYQQKPKEAQIITKCSHWFFKLSETYEERPQGFSWGFKRAFLKSKLRELLQSVRVMAHTLMFKFERPRFLRTSRSISLLFITIYLFSGLKFRVETIVLTCICFHISYGTRESLSFKSLGIIKENLVEEFSFSILEF